jgi:hypothetical protein
MDTGLIYRWACGWRCAIQASPKQAEVHVDGFYAGVVDDSFGVLQRLRARPAAMPSRCISRVCTVTQNIYVTPDDTRLQPNMDKRTQVRPVIRLRSRRDRWPARRAKFDCETHDHSPTPMVAGFLLLVARPSWRLPSRSTTNFRRLGRRGTMDLVAVMNIYAVSGFS